MRRFLLWMVWGDGLPNLALHWTLVGVGWILSWTGEVLDTAGRRVDLLADRVPLAPLWAAVLAVALLPTPIALRIRVWTRLRDRRFAWLRQRTETP